MSITARAETGAHVDSDFASRELGAFDTARARVDAALDDLTAATAAMRDPLEVAGWARQVEARVAAVRLAALAEADSRGSARRVGALSTAAWLKGQGVGAGAARREILLAGALADPDHASTRDRLAQGHLTPDHAIVITQAKERLSDQVDAAKRASFEAGLLAQAQSLDPRQLANAAKRAAAKVDPSGSGDLEAAERAARAQRELVIFQRDGMFVLSGRLDPEGAAYLSAALDPLAAPRPGTVDGPDPRTPARRRGDALVELSRRQLAAGDLPDTGGLPPQVVVTMTLDQLANGPADSGEITAGSAEMGAGAAEISGGTVREPLSAGRARRLACDARIIPAVLGGASGILDWGTERRTATPTQRKALALRDRGCTAPGCDRPPSWTQAHHLIPWSVQPNTDLSNLALVCDAHHDLLHHDGWTITLEDGHARWHPPSQAWPG